MKKWLAGVLAASTAFTLLSGSAATLMAEEPVTEYALAGAGSGQDVTVHFGDGEDQDISIHVNSESGSQDESAALAGAFSEEETESETETQEYSGLTASYIDQFGDAIGESYQAVPIPEFGDDGILNLEASDEYKPAADFAVWKDLTSKVIQYSYLRARLNTRTVKALRKGASDEKASEAVSGENDTQISDGYYYTYNNTDWEKLENTDSLEFVFTSGKQREYTFEDENIKVSATLQHAWAIPDGARLKVTHITPKSDDYNYSAYMDALNERVSEPDESDEKVVPYNDDNTLLYDFAFIAVKYDEEGNLIEGSDYEYEPADGSVKLDVEFKDSQLSKGLGASSAEDITVFHLPLAEKVKEETDTTAQATEITPSDISVETVSFTSDDVLLNDSSVEAVSFKADSFSTFVFTSGKSQSHYWTGSKKFTMSDILSSLGGLTNFAVVAGTLNTGDHIEGNIRVSTFEILSNGAEMNSGGRVDVQNNPDTFTVTKTVKNGSSDNETFNFVIVDETDNSNLYNFSITAQRQPDGTVSGSKTFTKDGSNGSIAAAEVFNALITNKHLVRVYELDSNNQRIQNGGKNGTMTVTYESIDSSGEAGEVGNSKQNYVGEFTFLDPTTMQRPGYALGMAADKLGPFVSGEQPHLVDGQPKNYIYFGNDNDVCIQNSSLDYFTYDPDLKTTINGDLNRIAQLCASLAKAYNGDTETAGSKNIGSNLNVINLISNSGNLQDDLTAAGFLAGSSVESNVIDGLLRRGEYLLINIDAGSFENYKINGQGIYYDHENPQGNDGYSDLGSHIIYNLVTSNDNQNTFTAYNKTVTVADWSAGLLLAPKADVVQDAYWVGEIIGGKVIHRGAEIHKKTTVSGTNREVTVDVVNTYPDDTDFTVKKKWLNSFGQLIDAPVGSINVKLYRKPAKVTGNVFEVSIVAFYNNKSHETLRTVYVKRPDTGNAAPFYFTIDDADSSHTYSTWDTKGHPFDVRKDGNTWIYSTDDLLKNNLGEGKVTVRVQCDVPRGSKGSVNTSNVTIRIPDGSYTPPDRSTVDSEEDTGWTKTVVLKKSEDWTYSLDQLETVDAEGNPYYYYAEEVDTSGKYAISYDNNGTQSGTITITNTIPTDTQVEVEKKWEGTPKVDEISFDLMYILGPVTDEGASLGNEDLSGRTDGSRYGTYTVTSAGGWKKTISNLPLYVRTGGQNYQYYYYVKENDVVGYEVSSYENNVGLTDGKITINNREKTTSLNVTKLWKDDGADITDKSQLPDVTVNVYRVKTKVDHSLDVMLTAASDPETVLTEAIEPEDDVQTEVQTEVATEKTTEKQTEKVTEKRTEMQMETSGQAEGETLLINPDTSKIEVKGVPLGAKICLVFTVYDFSNTIDCINSFADANQKQVPVTIIPGSRVDESDGRVTARFQSDPIDVNNQLYSSYHKRLVAYFYTGNVIDVKVLVLENSSLTGAPDDSTSGSSTEAELYATTITLSSSNNWSASLPDLPVEGIEDGEEYTYSYYVEEVPVTGFDASYTPSVPLAASVGGVEKTLYAPENGSITITNNKEKTNIPVTKTWQDSGNANGRRPTSIKLYLVADGTQVKTADVTPDKSGNWTYQFENLPKYKYTSGNAELIKYSVNEEPVEYYSLTNNTAKFDANGDTVISLINTENASYSMPATGGEGTRMIYLISIMLIGLAGAGFVLIRRRRWMSR